MDISVNYLAVLLAGVSSMIVGFLWYSPSLFGKPWMKFSGKTQSDLKLSQKEMGKYYGLSFALSLLTAYVLSHVMALSMHFFMYSGLMTGLTSAFWMWLGFVMPTQATGTIFGDSHFGTKKWNLLAINTGYQLAALIVMGIILGQMGY